MVFEYARLLQRFTLDKKEKVAGLQTLSAFVINPSLITGESKSNERIRFYKIFFGHYWGNNHWLCNLHYRQKKARHRHITTAMNETFRGKNQK
jgi:hypothetical protein